MPDKVLGVAGFPGYTLRSRRTIKSATGSVSTISTFEGGKTAILGLAASPSLAGSSLDLDDSDAPLWRLVVSTPDYETGEAAEISTTYELLGNDLQKDIWEHPSVAGLDNHTVREIRKKLADSSYDYTPSGVGLSIYNHLLRNQNFFIVSQYVLRVTQLVGSRRVLSIGFANAGKIFTSLDGELGLPSALGFTVADIMANPPEARAGEAFGWLKKTPTLTQRSDGKFVISIEYWLESWSTFLYQLAS